MTATEKRVWRTAESQITGSFQIEPRIASKRGRSGVLTAERDLQAALRS